MQVHNNNGTIQLSNETTINNDLNVAGGGNVTIKTTASNCDSEWNNDGPIFDGDIRDLFDRRIDRHDGGSRLD